MSIRVTCSQCSAQYKVPADRAGKRFSCRQCQSPVQVPLVAADAPAARSASPAKIPRDVSSTNAKRKPAAKLDDELDLDLDNVEQELAELPTRSSRRSSAPKTKKKAARSRRSAALNTWEPRIAIGIFGLMTLAAIRGAILKGLSQQAFSLSMLLLALITMLYVNVFLGLLNRKFSARRNARALAFVLAIGFGFAFVGLSTIPSSYGSGVSGESVRFVLGLVGLVFVAQVVLIVILSRASAKAYFDQ